MLSYTPVFALLCSICFYAGYTRLRRRNQLPLPPGPNPQFLVGNARQLPKATHWVVFAEWGKRYGGYFLFRVFGTPFLVINDAKVAYDLLDKRSLIYSDRPQSVMSELIGWDFNMTLYPYGPAWKEHRKAMHQALNARAARDYRPMQQDETNRFLKQLLVDPQAFLSHVEHLTGATIMRLTYGHRLKEGDGYVPMVKEAVHALTQSQGVGFLVDQLPILRYVPSWFPGAEFQRLAKKWRVSTRGILEIPFGSMKNKWLSGTAPASYCTRLLEDYGGQTITAEKEQVIKETSAVLYAAGTDSTSALISSFFLVCTLYPEVQAKAQEEIDRVVGSERLPDFGDRDSLPYVESLVKEVYRWNPAAPLGPAHYILKDDEYEGHLIPAGTTVLPNLWAMLHDESMYPSPFTFRPERFFEMDEQRASETDPRNFMFGFGRRICVGQHLADATVYTAISSILATFSISKSKDGQGCEITPEVSYPGFVGHPKPFQCTITPRTPKAAKLIQHAPVQEED